MDRFVAEEADFARLEGHGAVLGGVDGVVAAQERAFAGTLGEANLADNNLPGTNFLAGV